MKGAESTNETERVARLMECTFEGKPYYGPSVLGALEGVTVDMAVWQTAENTRDIGKSWRI